MTSEKMREILYRGKRKDTGKLIVSDSILQYDGLIKLWDKKDGYVEVEPETIGQYTGLTGKNGKKIFEGDIVRHYSGGKIGDDVGKIFYDTKNCKFLRTSKTNPKIHYELHADCVYEVIGNIYDNPELVKELL